VGQIEGQIWDSARAEFVGGVLSWNPEGIIDAVRTAPSSEALFVVPGFVDLHVHGSGGRDVMDASPEALTTIAVQLARYGVTGFLATTLTATAQDLARAVDAVAAYKESDQGAHILGMHLEGPFIDPEHRGAQPQERIRSMDQREMQDLLRRANGCIRLMTMAPEMPGGLEGISWLVEQGVRVNIGHTGATLEAAEEAIDRGADGVTHLFNAMPALHHRSPGPVGLALSDPRVFVEIIADGVHIHPRVVKMAFAAAQGRMVAITDGISAVGLPPGKHHLGELTVDVDEVAVRLPSGTLAGSKLTLDQAYRNLVSWGIDEAVVIPSLTETPWRRIGMKGHGRLISGLSADFVVMNRDRRVLQTVRRGRPIYTAPA